MLVKYRGGLFQMSAVLRLYGETTGQTFDELYGLIVTLANGVTLVIAESMHAEVGKDIVAEMFAAYTNGDRTFDVDRVQQQFEYLADERRRAAEEIDDLDDDDGDIDEIDEELDREARDNEWHGDGDSDDPPRGKERRHGRRISRHRERRQSDAGGDAPRPGEPAPPAAEGTGHVPGGPGAEAERPNEQAQP